MRVTFTGFEFVFDLSPDHVEVLEIENRRLFSRVCASLISDKREEAIEPFVYWKSEAKELSTREKPLIIVDPFNLPWADKRLLGALPARINKEILEDEEARIVIDNLTRELAGRVFGLTLGMEAGYLFDVEWDTARYLKAFGFTVDSGEDGMLIDNLEEFFKLAADAAFPFPFIFINIKSFLDEKDMRTLYNVALHLGFSLLLVESNVDSSVYEMERKHRIDLQFLEY